MRFWDPVWRVQIRPIRILCVLVGVVIFAWILGPRLMTGYARWLIRTDPPRQGDVAIVLAGGEGERLGAALRIWRQGRVGALMITGPDVALLPVYTGGDSLTMAEVKRRIAIKKGVPADDVWMALGARSTYDEAQDALRALKERGVHNAIVVTSPFHSRRARATFRQIFRGSGIDVTLETLPVDLSAEKPDRWWTREREMMAVFTETAKTVFYWNRYGISPF
jgi:uncharacterized SAM-binding protein YcdF (DUF218 family)